MTKTSNLFCACTPHTSHSEASLSIQAVHAALVLDSCACRQLEKMFIKVEASAAHQPSARTCSRCVSKAQIHEYLLTLDPKTSLKSGSENIPDF